MTTWRSEILKHFTPGVARLTVVADPDHLLLEPSLRADLVTMGYLQLVYDDPIAFRYRYEEEVRRRWDQSEALEVIATVVDDTHEVERIPFDLLHGSRRLSIGLPELFPNLDYQVISALDLVDLDELFSAPKAVKLQPLGESATFDFVLRYVFGIAPELVKQTTDLLHILLKKHYTGRHFPPALDQFLVRRLRQNSLFEDWPLEELVPNREVFLAFLQERWPHFLNHLAKKNVTQVRDELGSFGLHVGGPMNVPFDHTDVRVYVDNLFVEGHLQPVSIRDGEALRNTWAAFGIHTDPAGDRLRRLEKLSELVGKTIPKEDAHHGDWLEFAQRWAELRVLSVDVFADNTQKSLATGVPALQESVDVAFTKWLESRYGTLYNQPPVPAVMVHHIPRAMARYREEHGNRRVALIVLDGLALDQWHRVRQDLVDNTPHLRMREAALFAWIPTLTSVSRQSMFAGKPPFYFADTIGTTSKEPELWTRFWDEQKVSKSSVSYQNGLGKGDWRELEDLVSNPQIQILGMVVDTVDKMLHGMQLGLVGLHNQVALWAKGGYLRNLINLLLESQFTVWLSADHGNIEATGIGKLTEGAEADLAGTRARVYPSAALRAGAVSKAPESIEWKSTGLPAEYFALLAQGRGAFDTASKVRVTHGGAAIEEAIVPWIQIEAERR